MLELRVVAPEINGAQRVLGRDQELAQVHDGFAGSGPSGVHIQVLTGMGGVGKTSIARAYAHRHQQSYDLIWWLTAADPKTIEAQYRKLLEALAPDVKYSDAVVAMLAVLGARPGRWLLVVDNVDDPAVLPRIVPAAGNGHVVVTTRATQWTGDGKTIMVEPLARTPAAELLSTLSGDADDEAAHELAELVGDLPLALAQAGTYCRKKGVSLAKYVGMYRDQRTTLLGVATAPDYPASVAATFHLSFRQLSAQAVPLLNLLSFLAPDALPTELLFEAPGLAEADLVPVLRPLILNESVLVDARGELLDYGLVTMATGQFRMHRLVQDIVHDQMPDPTDRARWVDAARVLVTVALPDLPATARSILRWRLLQPHVLALLGHLRPTDPETIRLRDKLAGWTGQTGNVRAARDLYADLVPAYEQVLGASASETLEARGNWAHWTGEAGDAERAIEMCRALVQDCVNALGPEHPDTLIATSNLARWLGVTGNVPEARDLARRVLEIRERRLGPKHPDTLLVRSNFAHWTAQAGDSATAMRLYTALVPLIDEVLGPKHNVALAARANLAQLTGQAGNARAAREQYEELVRVRERVLGPEQRETLRARNWLALWTGRAGDPAAARDQFRELVPLYEKVFGPDDGSTSKVRESLARWTERARR